MDLVSTDFGIRNSPLINHSAATRPTDLACSSHCDGGTGTVRFGAEPGAAGNSADITAATLGVIALARSLVVFDRQSHEDELAWEEARRLAGAGIARPLETG
jgi:hypothetical protein